MVCSETGAGEGQNLREVKREGKLFLYLCSKMTSFSVKGQVTGEGSGCRCLGLVGSGSFCTKLCDYVTMGWANDLSSSKTSFMERNSGTAFVWDYSV